MHIFVDYILCFTNSDYAWQLFFSYFFSGKNKHSSMDRNNEFYLKNLQIIEENQRLKQQARQLIEENQALKLEFVQKICAFCSTSKKPVDDSDSKNKKSN